MMPNSVELHSQQLDNIREAWFHRFDDGAPLEDRTGITIVLDSSQVSDIPTFLIALGEAVNGPDGYYGGCLNGVNDCLYGGFGLLPPFILEVVGLEELRHTLNASEDAWEEVLRKELAEEFPEEDLEDDSPATQEPPDPSFFETLMEIFAEHKVTVREYGQRQ